MSDRPEQINRLKAEVQRLEEENRRLRQALTLGGPDDDHPGQADEIGSWVLDRATGHLRWSSQVHAIFGLDKNQFNGTIESFEKLIHPDDRSSVLKAMEDSRRNQSPFDVTHRILRPDGTQRLVRERSDLTLEDKGGGRLRVGTIADLTRRQSTEAALRQTNATLRAIMSSSPLAVMILDLEGRVLIWSGAAEKTFGWREEEVLGRHNPVVPPENLEEFNQQHRRVAAEEVAARFEVQCLCKNGERIHVSQNLAPIQGLYGRVTSVLSLAEDITERKRAEQALRGRETELDHKAKELEDMNTALEVLLLQRDKDIHSIKERVFSNLTKLVLPYIDKLEAEIHNSRHRNLLDIIHLNLGQLVTPWAHQLSSTFKSLTPNEIRVASLVKEGRTNKEIAEVLDVSPKTIEYYRDNIRSKLGIKGKKVNLRTHLMSMS